MQKNLINKESKVEQEPLQKKEILKKQLLSKKRFLSLIPALIMMIIIFLFSSKTAVESNDSSSVIANFLLETKEQVFGSMDSAKREITLEFINHIVRKAAHMTEYAVLAILLGIHFYTIKVGIKKYFILNIGICVLYAMSDEFHQLFVEGRSGQSSDVGIDSIGIIIGTLIFYFLMRERMKQTKLEQSLF